MDGGKIESVGFLSGLFIVVTGCCDDVESVLNFWLGIGLGFRAGIDFSTSAPSFIGVVKAFNGLWEGTVCPWLFVISRGELDIIKVPDNGSFNGVEILVFEA